MIPSSGCPPCRPDYPRTLPRTGTPTPPRGARPWKHNKPLLARACYALAISQDLTALGLGQARHDVEERGLTATAWTEKTDELALQHGQGYVLQSLDGGPL